ncbi:c-type cytochrome biogenesis protein CcsB [Rarobacter incanus]|uniref:Heme exporter protein C n=1 Tax=Rarobacter incanus TaxID=153494 RepID=A0A542SQR1_9MICO|nr:c-type cytochrome biogenesis protein CcsB [Rarobacter incanus]TQK76950.1 cytochrome c-type biogenesis protein CcsB [Rarobacter incanus]
MNVGQVSDVLAWGTATAYAIAMITFTITLVTGRGVVGEVDLASAAASARRRAKTMGISKMLVFVGAAMHLAAVVTRGVAAGRAPWANMYEFTLVGSLIVVIVFLVFALWRGTWFLGAGVTAIAVVFLVLGLRQLHVAADGVQPALQSYWLVIHVGIAVGGAGVFTVGFLFAVLQLLRDSYDSTLAKIHAEPGQAVQGGGILRWAWLTQLPKAPQLEVLAFRVNAVGFVLWTFTLITGAIWAEDAWGRYWQWDPKEVWTFIVWIVYAAYLHARATQRWTGRRAAYLVIAGYACVLFNFTGVNLIFNGKHSYSGL